MISPQQMLMNWTLNLRRQIILPASRNKSFKVRDDIHTTFTAALVVPYRTLTGHLGDLGGCILCI